MNTLVNLGAGWAKIWAAVSGAIPGLAVMLGVFGTAIAAYAVFKFIMDKRKGGGGNTKELGWMLVFACLVILPNTIIPLLLRFASFVVNFVIGLAQGL